MEEDDIIITDVKLEPSPNNEDFNATPVMTEQTQSQHSIFDLFTKKRSENVGIFNKNSEKMADWSYRIWCRWRKDYNAQVLEQCENGQDGTTIELIDEMENLSDEKLSYWLSLMVYQAKDSNGDFYKGETLYKVFVNLQRFLRSKLNRNVDFFNKACPSFATFRNALNERIKQLSTMETVNTSSASSSMVLERSISSHSLELLFSFDKNEEKLLWEKEFHNLSTANSWIKCMIYYNCKQLSLTTTETHRELNAENFVFGSDEHGEYVDCQKHRRSLDNQFHQDTSLRIYGMNNGSHDYVSLLKRYIQMIPSVGPFYRRPHITVSNRDIRFSHYDLGLRQIARFYKEMQESLSNKIPRAIGSKCLKYSTLKRLKSINQSNKTFNKILPCLSGPRFSDFSSNSIIANNNIRTSNSNQTNCSFSMLDTPRELFNLSRRSNLPQMTPVFPSPTFMETCGPLAKCSKKVDMPPKQQFNTNGNCSQDEALTYTINGLSSSPNSDKKKIVNVNIDLSKCEKYHGSNLEIRLNINF